ncbi:MAG TPA: hypothetical protein VK645_18485 [Chitinophagaceae bacterium]|nr:hypothetical protein [Chitinophagaceae bacterium]
MARLETGNWTPVIGCFYSRLAPGGILVPHPSCIQPGPARIVMNGGLATSEQSGEEMFYGDGSFRYGQRDIMGNMKDTRSGDTYSRGSFGDHTKKK